MGALEDLASLPPHQLFDGIVARAVHGERLTLGVLELDPGALVAEHSHDNEQLGICLRGSITLGVGDEERSSAPAAPGGSRRTCHTGARWPRWRGRDRRLQPAAPRLGTAERLEPRQPRWP